MTALKNALSSLTIFSLAGNLLIVVHNSERITGIPASYAVTFFWPRSWTNFMNGDLLFKFSFFLAAGEARVRFLTPPPSVAGFARDLGGAFGLGASISFSGGCGLVIEGITVAVTAVK